MKEKKFSEMKRDREVWRALKPKINHLEKLWLLDVGGDYRLYISRLYKLATDHGVEIPKIKD